MNEGDKSKVNEATAQLKQVNDTEKWLMSEWDEERRRKASLVRLNCSYISMELSSQPTPAVISALGLSFPERRVESSKPSRPDTPVEKQTV